MWRELIVYCVKNSAYIGCDLPDLGIDEENDADENIDKPKKDTKAAGKSPPESKDEVHPLDSRKSETAASSDPSQSTFNDPVISVSPPKPFITKDIHDFEQKSASQARSKKMPCAKFIAQSSSPSPTKICEKPKTQYDTTDNVQWGTFDKVQEKSGPSPEGGDVSEKVLPKPQREPRVRLINKNRKRRERTIFDRVLRRDNDTDSDSNCSRDWFPTIDEWLLTDQSEGSTQDDGQSDQSVELIGRLSTMSTSSDQSETITNSPDQSGVKRPIWSTVDEMLNKLVKESQQYREQFSVDRPRPKSQKENGTKREKGGKVERNLVLEAIFKSKEKLPESASDKKTLLGSGNNLFSIPNDPHKANIEQSNHTSGCSKTMEACADFELNESKSNVADADECSTATENSSYDDLTKANDEDYKRLMKMCQPVITEDPPSELEAKIIRQIEYYFGDYNLPKDKFLKDVMAKNDGWVPLKTVATFNKMKELTGDLDVIRTALRKSPNQIVQISLGGSMLSRSSENPLPSDTQQWKRNLQDKCIYVEGLPAATASLETLEEYFQKWGGVYHIEMPRGEPFQHQTAAVVVFKDASSVKDVLKESHVYQNHRLSVSFRSDAVGLLSKKRRAKSSITRNTQSQEGTRKAYERCPGGYTQVVDKTEDYMRYRGSRETQQRSDQYKMSMRKSHGSRDDPNDHVIQHPAASSLEQRPRRAPRSSRSQTQVDPWYVDDNIRDKTDRVTRRQESLKKLHVNVKNTRSNCTPDVENLTSHILENMDVDQLRARKNPVDLKSSKQESLGSDVNSAIDLAGNAVPFDASKEQDHIAEKFPMMYSDVRIRDQLDSNSSDFSLHSLKYKLPSEDCNEPGVDSGALEAGDFHVYPDDLTQGDSDVVVEESSDDEDD